MAEQASWLPTSRGEARLTVEVPRGAPAVALLMHGAGGDSSAAVLVRTTASLVAAGIGVVRLDQPYRVAGRRAPDPAARLDEVALEVVAHLRRRWRGRRLVVGGKSSGARVACRIAADAGADAVVALGFPLHPPGRPERSRAPELLGVACPTLVVQGARDSFGTPDDVREVLRLTPPAAPVTVHAVEGGDHSFAARRADGRTREECLEEVAGVARDFVLSVVVQAT